jgi:hypothetical protein
MGRIQQLEQEAARLAKKAEARGDIRTAIAARRELMRIVELLAKIQMADNAQVSKNIGPSIRIVVEPLIKPSDMQPEPIEGFAVRLPD